MLTVHVSLVPRAIKSVGSYVWTILSNGACESELTEHFYDGSENIVS